MGGSSKGWMRRIGLGGCAITLLGVGMGVVSAGSEPGSVPQGDNTQRVELGRRLFFDPVVSRTGMRACADCHDPVHGYADEEAISRDARGPTPRRSQTLVDCVNSPSMDWHGAFERMEDLVAARTEASPRSAGSVYYGGVVTPFDPTPNFVSNLVPDSQLPASCDVLADAGRYRRAFAAAFDGSTPTASRIVTAISAYCRSIRSGTSDYDRFVAGDATALSTPARRGLELFRGRAGCATCHKMTGQRAAFTDYAFHDVGIPEIAAPLSILSVPALRGLSATVVIPALGPPIIPPALAPPAVPGGPIPHPGFKTPTLRDVALRAPYMHDGSLATLEDAVRFFLAMPTAGAESPEAAPAWTDGDVGDLVAFLSSLTSKSRPGAARQAWSLRASTTRLRFADAKGDPLAGWPVDLVPAGDDMPGAPSERVPLHLVTDARGWVSFTPPPTTHVRIVLEGGLLPEGGCWIPDTCTESRIVVPIRGLGRLCVTLPLDAPVSPYLELQHEEATLRPERKTPFTLLRRECVVHAVDRVVAIYAGVIRSDVAPQATLVVPPGLACEGKDEVPVTLLNDSTVAVRFIAK